MKTFLVNLENEKERLAAITAQLKRLGVAYERISAINGKNLSQQERSASVNHFRWWCAVGRPCRPGEIGCALSHYSIYRRISHDLSPVCILEDDVILDLNFNRIVEYVETHCDCSRPQVILLSDHTGAPLLNDFKCGVKRCHEDKYTEGYIITPKAASALLKANLPMECPCDWWGRWASRGIIELYHAFPTVCRQDQGQYESGTCGKDDFDVSRLSLPMYLFHKAKRLVGKSIDIILR